MPNLQILFATGILFLSSLTVRIWAAVPSPEAMILLIEEGKTPLDHQIADLQTKIKATAGEHRAPLIEQLGWLLVAKARLSNDPGYYKLAEQCALCLETALPHDSSAMLLRGHALDAMHRFHDAETIARDLATSSPTDWKSYALLGDVLMEQGQLAAAVEAYQEMLDTRPCAPAYLRVGHMRWLKGDLAGATEMCRLAVRASNPQDAEPAAWMQTRLGLCQFQAGDAQAAARSLERALQLVPDYAPALLLKGRMQLVEGNLAEALTALKMAAAQNPLPEYEWALADAQREAGLTSDAQKTEAHLLQSGAANDARTFVLYLATRGEKASTALALARAELETRHDVFTFDALAWALLAAGETDEASTQMRAALAEGTQDARMFLHAGVIMAAAGERKEADGFFHKASESKQLLLPSERTRLAAAMAVTPPPVSRTSPNPLPETNSNQEKHP